MCRKILFSEFCHIFEMFETMAVKWQFCPKNRVNCHWAVTPQKPNFVFSF
ncbi:hypothetical protein HanIR_Chr13g0649541 [Helianthus annuus]|nr:hypothetical protein HanIR_Chr13g0649541 [Helianthus annuus]